jgi:energy-coupling factor transport system ATP-binding protein
LVVPILEQTVERAIALGGSMELRGFAATRRPDPDCERPVVIEDVDLGFEGGWILEGIDLRVEPATLTLISGPTGSGKSTLLHAISGLFQHQFGGEQAGRITVGGSDRMSTPPRETAGFVGVVSQSVRLSFVAATVREEVGFALAVRGVDPTIVAARVTETAAHLGIERLLHRDLVTLSAGEACLVAIAAALVERPLVLLVDEPLAELDTSARQRVVGLLGRLAHEAGVCVIVAEHALAEWDAVVDVRLELRDAHLRPGRAAGARSEPIASGHGLLSGATVAEIGPLSVSYDEQRVVDEVQLSLAAQEIVALSGSNGAGKSSLLHAIARPNQRDTVRVGGRDVHRMHRRARRRAVTLVPEQFDDLIFATTVAAECRRADRAAALAGAGRGTAATFFGLIGVSSDRAQRMLQRHPRDLSAGERLCLVIAIQLSTRPSLLLVDEPTRGLDAAARELLGAALTRSAATGTAVLFATHDAGFAARFADRTIDMIEGRVAAAVGVQP